MWKVLVSEKDAVKSGQTLAILEAMKLEINVNVPDDSAKATVEKILVEPGDIVKAGEKIALLRNAS